MNAKALLLMGTLLMFSFGARAAEIVCDGPDDAGSPVHLSAMWAPGESLTHVKAEAEDFEDGHFTSGDKKIANSNKDFEKQPNVDAFVLDREAADQVLFLPKAQPKSKTFSVRMGEADEAGITYELKCSTN